MRRLILLVAGVGAVVALIWATGLWDAVQGDVSAWLKEAQRSVQTGLARAVRALKAGQPGALAGLLSVSFLYGLAHAAGPGHGKLVIGTYGLSARVPLWRLAALAVISSLAQGLVAVVLVLATVAVLGWGRERVEAAGTAVLAPLGAWLLAGLGLWLAGRGVRRLWRRQAAPADGHDHVHDEHCNHAHGPSVEDISRLTGWRDAALLIAGIALRPCSGALVLMVLAVGLGVTGAGILGVLAMAAGTAVITGGFAGLAVWAREGAFAWAGSAAAARALPWAEVLAGLAVLLAALALLP